MSECIFCKIARGETPTKILYQDDQVIAFPDLDPKAPQHILIIPKRHINTLNDFTAEDTVLAGQLLQVARKLAAELDIAEYGYRVLINCNAGGGQAVYHLHVHLLGGRKMHWPPG